MRDRTAGRATDRELVVVAAVLVAGSEKAADVEVGPDAGGLDILVTFTPDEASFRASCTIVAGSA